MSCQFRVGVPTILLQHHDTRPSSPMRRDCRSRSCISTQYVSLLEVHGSLKNMFIIVLGQKEASPRAMKIRRSLSFVLTLFLTLSRLVFLNRGIRTLFLTLSRLEFCMDGHSLTQAHYT